MPQSHRSSAELDALKTLVAVYGPREAARIAQIPYGTIASYSVKFKWKKIELKKPQSHKDNVQGKDSADLLAEALEKHRNDSTLHLAQYVANASKKAATHGDPLEVARKVRDVAGVHQIIFPRDEEGGLIEGAILIGTEKVELDQREIEDARAKEVPTIDVRAEVQDN